MKSLILLMCFIVATAWSAPAPVAHRFLKSGCGSQSVAIVRPDGQVEWEYPIADETSDAWQLPNGNVIFAYKHGVREVRPDRSTAWDYPTPAGTEIHSCQPIDDNLFLVGESHSNGVSYLYELDRAGAKHKAVMVRCGGSAHSQFRQVRKTPQGTYLVTSLVGGGSAQEIDGDGKVLRTIPGGRYVAIRLPDGNTLVACGDGHRVIEVDPQDRVVWEVKQDDIPSNTLGFVAGLQRLPNGNTVICNWSGHGGKKDQPQVVEITRDKQVVWEVRNPALHLISSINILDAPAPALR